MNIFPRELEDKLTDDVTLVLVSADWCGPCKAIKPIMDGYAKDHPDVPFLYITISDRGESLDVPLLAGLVRGFPSLMVFENKEFVKEIRTSPKTVHDYFTDYFNFKTIHLAHE